MPTLTEVVDFGGLELPHETPLEPAPDEALAAPDEPTASEAQAVPPSPLPLPDTNALVTQVLAELAPRIDMLLESRLREALAPALARAADGLIRESRDGLTRTLRELVEEAVERALRRRGAD